MSRIKSFWQRFLDTAFHRGPKTQRKPVRRNRTELFVESLEDRTVPSLAQPSLFTVSGLTTVTLGQSTTLLNDTATLAGGDNPTGTIRFELDSPTGQVVYNRTVPVNGDGTYSTQYSYTLPIGHTVTGSYQWTAAYSGDGQNAQAQGHSQNYDPNPVTTSVSSQWGSTVGMATDSTGNLFGVSATGGTYSKGYLYEVSSAGQFSVLMSFHFQSSDDIVMPGLTEDAHGNLYGAISFYENSEEGDEAGGYGSVYEYSTITKAFTIVASFSNATGGQPLASPIVDSRGDIFGTTTGGNYIDTSYTGTFTSPMIYEIPAGTNTIEPLATFNEGYDPLGLVEDGQGNLFGMTEGGGTNDNGTVFELAAGSHSITTLASDTFGEGGHNSNGISYGNVDCPNSNDAYLVMDANGDLFGALSDLADVSPDRNPQSGNLGFVFEVAHGSGVMTKVASFDSGSGAAPTQLVIDGAGDLFGTALGNGNFGESTGPGFNPLPTSDSTVFEVAANSHTITTLATLISAQNLGYLCSSPIVEDSAGDLRGTAYNVYGQAYAFTVKPEANPLTVEPANPFLVLTPSPSTAVLGAGPTTITASAYLAGGYDPTGTLKFSLVGHLTSNTTTVFGAVTVFVHGDGTYSLPAGDFQLQSGVTVTGQYDWTVQYTGDGNNNPTLEKATQVVDPATPTITTTPNASTITLGTTAPTLTDTAVVSNGYYPLGTLTFMLYATGDPNPVHTEAVAINGDGSYTTPAGYTLPTNQAVVGTYLWEIRYTDRRPNGDNQPTDITNPVEQVVVYPADPKLSTAATPAAVTLGNSPVSLSDTATIAGGYFPTGTIDFTLDSPTGQNVFSVAIPINGNGNYDSPLVTYLLPTLKGVTGTFQWNAAYVGNANNNPATDNNNPAERSVVSTATPLVVTTPSPTSVTLGSASTTLRDTATISGGYYPTGTITFTLFDRGNANALHTESVSINGNGSYTTPVGYPVPTTGVVAGVYQWYATYSGNANNNSCSSRATGEIESLATLAGPTDIGTVVADANGDVFGTTAGGEASPDGTVFEIRAGSGAATTLITFNGTNGANPIGGLIEDASGDLFGTTEFGGANSLGTVFEIMAGSHTLVTLASFTGANGQEPMSGLYEDSAGNLFGTTDSNSLGYPTIYEVSAGTRTITSLAIIPFKDSYLTSGVVEDKNGNLYGTFSFGVTIGKADVYGVVYKVAAGTHQLSNYAAFDGVNGDATGIEGDFIQGSTLVEDAQGDLFGTTYVGGDVAGATGTVYEIAAGTRTIDRLASFDPNPSDTAYPDGECPVGNIAVDSAGNVFGATYDGGPNGSTGGVVYEVTAGTDHLVVLDSLPAVGGADDISGISEDFDGNLYGALNFRDVVYEVPAVEETKVNPADPTLAAKPTRIVDRGSLATTLMDTATLTGAFDGTGTITFTLYAPGQSAPVDTETVSVSGNGTYTTPHGYDLPTRGPITGTYQWDVTYSDDTNNQAVSDNNNPVEKIVISPTSPTLTTTAPSSTTLSVNALTLNDSAMLVNGYFPSGTITFTLYLGTKLVDTQWVSVSGIGSYETPTGYTLPTTGTVAGAYQWDITYSGDSNNLAATDNNSPTGRTTVHAASPTLTTPLNSITDTLGSMNTFRDSVLLSGGYDPTGTITFQLCEVGNSNPVYTENVNVSGNGTYDASFRIASGNSTWSYDWVVVYSGDSNNQKAVIGPENVGGESGSV